MNTKQSMTTNYSKHGASISIHDVEPGELKDKAESWTREERDGDKYLVGKINIGDIDIVLFSRTL